MIDMLSSHELFGFMSPPLAVHILEHAHENNKELYRGAMSAVAEAHKLRPAFFERRPRATRHAEMTATLSNWLMKEKTPMLSDFLDKLGITHKDGAVDNLPATVEDASLKAAIDLILSKYPAEEVTVYLNAFYTMNDVRWPNLEAMLKEDPRLQFGG
jgi:hypothetical protein